MQPRAGLLAAVALAACGCAANPGVPPANGNADTGTDGGESIQARGNEPGWHLEIAGDRVVLVTDYGETRVEAPVSAVTHLAGGRVYTAPRARMTVTVLDELCHDDMSGMPYPRRVRLEHEGRTLRGCAGEPVDLLLGAEWQIATIDDSPTRADARPVLGFTRDGRVSGSASCNRFTTAYRLSGESLTFSEPVATTRRMCPAAIMEQEARFLNSLAAVTDFDIDADGSLLLLDRGDLRLRARR